MRQELRPAILMERQLGWAHKLGGTESQAISRVGQTVSQADGGSNIISTCQVRGSVGEWFRKRIMASAHLSVWEKTVLQLPP